MAELTTVYAVTKDMISKMKGKVLYIHNIEQEGPLDL